MTIFAAVFVLFSLLVDASTLSAVTAPTTITPTGTNFTTTTPTQTSQAFICEPGCKFCSSAVHKREQIQDLPRDLSHGALEPLEDRSTQLRKRALKEIDGTGWEKHAGRYMNLQVATQRTKRIEWVQITTDLASVNGDFQDNPDQFFVKDVAGCTAIAIVSEKGAWLGHMMEPSFMYKDAGLIARWRRLIQALQDGNRHATSPFSLVDAGGLNQKNNVKIYISSPRTGGTPENPVWLYGDRVIELVDLLTGRGQPFEGVEVISRGYIKPDENDDEDDYRQSARGKVFIEYDNIQVEATKNSPRKAMSRVWLEDLYFEHLWDRPCDPSSRKRDGSCPITLEAECKPPEEYVPGLYPEAAAELAAKFCEDAPVDIYGNAGMTLGAINIGLDSHALDAVVRFTFENVVGPDCAKSCADIYDDLIQNCAYDSHLFIGGATKPTVCGNYSLQTEERAPQIINTCVDPTIWTSFTLDQATEAIVDFCNRPEEELALPDAAMPLFKTYPMEDVTLQLLMHWSGSSPVGCISPDGFSNTVTPDQCYNHFMAAVNNCDTDTMDDKYGNMPMVWNSPIGCIDFEIYGDGVDWECGVPGPQPIQCGDDGVELDG